MGSTGILTQAEYDVLLEREKQRDRWSAKHDDDHHDASLAEAAAYLAEPEDPSGCADLTDEAELAECGWAVQLRHKHRDDRRQQLVIAAALAIAEIERLDRIRLSGRDSDPRSSRVRT